MLLLKNLFEETLKTLLPEIKIPEFNIEICENKFNAHYCTNVLFKLKPHLNESFLQNLTSILKKNCLIENVEIVNLYINLTMSCEYFLECFKNFKMLPNIGNEKKINVEYCSLNPTGFMHIGHVRNAIIGECIAKVLEKINYKVTREYYVNDAGNQINLLADSVLCRYNQIANAEIPFIENGYNSEEIKKLAKTLKGTETKEEVKKLAVNFFIKNIKKDLKTLGIVHDKWVYESKIVEKNYMQKAFEIFRKKKLIYESTREEKQNEKGNVSKTPIMLLKTSLFGDDLDRPLTKEDGSWTYFATDIAYHLNKIKRKYSSIITVLGADHDSYATRLKIATNLLDPKLNYNIIKCQMVSFENNGNLIKFSKRKGNALYFRDFIKQIDANVLKFMLLDQTPGNIFVFNYEKALSMSMSNPVFYCNYAFSRANSLTKGMKNDVQVKVEAFESKAIQELLVHVFDLPQILEKTYLTNNPCFLTKYLIKISEKFHKLWQEGKENVEQKIITENAELSEQKLKIVQLFLTVSKEVFSCLSITPLKIM